jgi:chromatin structure-remodeling complex subunit RSC9
MQRVFEVSPRAEMTQVTFWNLYKSAFATYGTESMLPATELIKTVTTIFPTAMAMVIPGAEDKPAKFVIKGLERKRAAAEGRTKCNWDRWGCPEPAFASPAALYAHVQSHNALSRTTRCRWGSCTHESPNAALFEAHLFTHLPLQVSVTRHPGQVDDLIIPNDFDVNISTPIGRPVPPGPQPQMSYTKTREDPTSSSFSSLLIMRILFRTSFVQAEVVMKTDSDHFGFPGIEQPITEVEDGPASDDLGFNVIEGQRRGKAAFKAVGSMLSRVQIHDQIISGWVDEMVDIIKSLPVDLPYS